jgi:hypothetical protein
MLAPAFRTLCEILISEKNIDENIHSHILDSMPIVAAKASRSGKAKSANGLCSKGYCASKDMYYYGAKLHVLGQKQHKTLPKMGLAELTEASKHDLTAAKEFLTNARNLEIFADKAYIDSSWFSELRRQNIRVLTPVKLEKGQKFLDSADKLFSELVSKARQAIESFFNWIQEKTNIQNASKVRSDSGLISFIFARLASMAFFYW